MASKATLNDSCERLLFNGKRLSCFRSIITSSRMLNVLTKDKSQVQIILSFNCQKLPNSFNSNYVITDDSLN